jgi:hypothetical protein
LKNYALLLAFSAADTTGENSKTNAKMSRVNNSVQLLPSQFIARKVSLGEKNKKQNGLAPQLRFNVKIRKKKRFWDPCARSSAGQKMNKICFVLVC